MRDQFFMILLYDTGGRIQEIINIRINDLKIGKISCVLLHSKGQKDRIVSLMDRTVDHLKKYMSFFHPDKSYAWVTCPHRYLNPDSKFSVGSSPIEAFHFDHICNDVFSVIFDDSF